MATFWTRRPRCLHTLLVLYTTSHAKWQQVQLHHGKGEKKGREKKVRWNGFDVWGAVSTACPLFALESCSRLF